MVAPCGSCPDCVSQNTALAAPCVVLLWSPTVPAGLQNAVACSGLWHLPLLPPPLLLPLCLLCRLSPAVPAVPALSLLQTDDKILAAVNKW